MDEDCLGKLKGKHIIGKNGVAIELIYIENILSKYIGYVEDCYYAKGLRYPLADNKDISKYKKTGMLSEQLIYPIYAAELIKSIIELYVVEYTNYKEDFFVNKLLDTSNQVKIYQDINRDTTLEDIILKMVPTITKVDYNDIIKYLSNITKVIENIVTTEVDNIVVVDIETNIIEINVYSNILAYRFEEACIHNKYNNIIMPCDINYDMVDIDYTSLKGSYHVH